MPGREPQKFTLKDILITEELFKRSPRTPDWLSLTQAVESVARQMAANSPTLLQSIVDILLNLCGGGSAGISLLETTANGEEVFHTHLLAGALAQYVNGTTKRSLSFCSVCLDCGSPQLFSHPERYFTPLQAGNTQIVEALVLPLIADNHTLGTIWVMSHDISRHFDSQDVRVMTLLADFTTATLLNSRQTQELQAANAAKTAQIVERKLTEESLRALISNLPGGAVFVVDQNLRYLVAEGEALAIAGFQREEFVGRTIFEVLPSELTTYYEPMYRQALAGEGFEHEHNAHDRTYISRGTPLRAENGEIYAVLAVSYDITDRKRAEIALRESEAKYRSLFESIDEGFCIIEVLDDESGKPFDHVILQANRAFTQQSGLENPEGKRASELMPGVEGFCNELYARVIETNTSERSEIYSEVFKRWFEVLVSPMSYGSTRRVAATFADITERKCTEAALRESEAKYRSLFENVNDGFCIIEMLYDDGQAIDYRFLEVNPAFEIQSGFKHAIGKTARDFLPNLEAELLANYERVLATGEPIEFEIQPVDVGRYLRIAAYPYGDPQNKQLAIVFSDITERKLSEEKLRRAAQMDAFRVKLSDALRSLTDPVEIQAQASQLLGEHLGVDRTYYVEVNEAEGYARVNQNYLRGDFPSLVGVYGLADYGWTMPFLKRGETIIVADAQTSDIVPKADREAMATVKISAHITVPVIKAGALVGSLCVTESAPREWSEAEVELVRETAERIWATIIRAHAETELRESEIRRVREQSAREQERQRAETLAELDRAKTLFFSNVSHEFRTPLTLILAPVQDALSDWVNPLPEVQRERLELVHRNTLRLLKLVNTLLDFSRIEAGRMEAVYEPTDLALYTTELASVFRSAIEQARLRLVVDCPSLAESVYVDRQMWEKIVLNLLSNAFKFTFVGEIAVRLHLVDDHHVTLQVQDTGTGIEPEQLPYIMKRFYQVRAAKARTHEGSGIGLALVHELVKLHGGTIDVTSAPGVGSCFTVTIPLGTVHLPNVSVAGDDRARRIQATSSSTALGAVPYVQEAERWIPQEGEGVKGKGKKDFSTLSPSHILIVDDNADMRDYLTRILSEHLEVQAVADGAAALAAVNQKVPDLVLSDVMMPELDGFGLLKALRTDARTKEIPIILLSARAGEESIVEGLLAGADDYLIKPFSANELVTRVNAYLQMANMRSQALHQERTINRRKDEVLSVVSHELNTPLVAILGWTRLLRSNPPNPAMLSKALETIERNATLQAKLVQDLLDISRITAGKIYLNQEPVELQEAIDRAIATVQQSLQTKNIRLNCQLAPSPVIIQGDSERLQQIILNLLTNAVKFTPNGGKIEIGLQSHEDRAEITVTDTGCGIDAEFIPYIFETFSQAPSTKKGLGLGLAIARSLVELHGGTIAAHSPGIGQGTIFSVKLPTIA
ncbi:MAG: ATP-binding protein [Nostoc sp. ChiSLP02]|nr:ATP-binding protein [Nostoc sp. DedSLP05]MDZ8099672.1 ATP-binding protein [Nostoc sp. DedSLP01]MDZ8186071.1 ATP-binding protein [Nostoc sp. ChiSLP02]